MELDEKDTEPFKNDLLVTEYKKWEKYSGLLSTTEQEAFTSLTYQGSQPSQDVSVDAIILFPKYNEGRNSVVH